MSAESASSPSGRHSVRLQRRPGRKRRYVLAALLLLLALGAGAVIGAGGTIMYMVKKRLIPPRPREVGNSIVREMADSLGLGDGETASLRSLIGKHMEKIDGIRKRSWDDIRGQLDAMQDEVVELIGPERYEKWENERDRRMGTRRNPDDDRKRPPFGYDPHRWRERREQHGSGMSPDHGMSPGMRCE